MVLKYAYAIRSSKCDMLFCIYIVIESQVVKNLPINIRDSGDVGLIPMWENGLGVRLCQRCCRKCRDSGSPGSVSTWSPNCTNSGLLLWGGAAFPKSRANPNPKKLVHPKLLLFRWQEDTALCFPPSRFLLPLPKTSRTPSQNNWKPPFFHTITNFLPIKPLIFKCHLNGSRHF